MNIVYASNDAYAKHLGVSLYSLLDNNRPQNEVNIYILSIGISDESKEKILIIGKLFAAGICFIELSDLKEKFGYEVNTGKFDISAMGRFFIGEMLPDEIDRVLYLDCDTVVLKSLNALWNIDLKDNILGAVMEPTIYGEIRQKIGLDNLNPYFNSGVLLIDIKKWRESDIKSKLIEYYKTINNSSLFCDQDAINAVLKGKIKVIAPRYNFFTNYRYYKYETLIDLSPSYRRYPKKVFNEAKKHPAIIHFAGDERPWKRGNLNHYRYAYDIYKKLTLWREIPKERGSEVYMIIYHVINYITYLCPQLRKKISDLYFLKLKNDRSR